MFIVLLSALGTNFEACTTPADGLEALQLAYSRSNISEPAFGPFSHSDAELRVYALCENLFDQLSRLRVTCLATEKETSAWHLTGEQKLSEVLPGPQARWNH